MFRRILLIVFINMIITCQGWLAMMTLCFLYNAWVIPFRYIFSEYQTEDNYHVWFIIDYCIVDLAYLVDVLVFKHRIMYMENGFWVKVCSG